VRSFVLLGLVLLAACGARTGVSTPSARRADASMPDAALVHDAGVDARAIPPDAGVDATSEDAFVPVDAFTPDAGDPCEIGPEPLREPICTRPLFGEAPSLSCPGGFVDVAAQGDGVLAWECMGDRAEARFGDRAYRGTRSGDRVSLCIRTEFDYVDGCRWQTSQRIEGDTTGAALGLTYREIAISGDGSCFPPCTADSVVELR
jgi:hypothetical protein